MRTSKKKKPSIAAEPTIAYVATKSKKNKPLTAADWVRPGRPATDKEMEQLVEEMMSEEGGVTTDELRKKIKSWCRKK